MGRASGIQHTFNGGEISPLMLGRQDLEQYAKSLYTCYNSLPLVHGGWTRRPGTLFLWYARDSGASAVRLLPFKYSLTQAYLLEFGVGYIRFFADHGILTEISSAATGVVTYTGTDPSNGDRVIVQGVVGMTQVNNCEFVVTNVNAGANTFELYDISGSAVDTTGYDAYVSDGTAAVIIEVTTSFTENDLADIR